MRAFPKYFLVLLAISTCVRADGTLLVPQPANPEGGLIIKLCDVCKAAEIEDVDYFTGRVLKDVQSVIEAGSSISQEQLETILLSMFNIDGMQSLDQRRAACQQLRGLSSNQNTSVRRILNRRIDVVEALIEGLQRLPQHSDAAQKIADEIAFRLTEYELGGREYHARIVWEHLQKLGMDFPEVSAVLKPVVHRHFLQPNIHVVISEGMANLFAQNHRLEAGCVNECVLGARVLGGQHTNVDSHAELIPCETRAQWKIVGIGKTSSKTQAHKHPAVISSIGRHCFRMERVMHFHQGTVVFHEPRIAIDVNTLHMGATTSMDRVPIVRGVARHLALTQANLQKPKADRVVAGQIRREALPEFRKHSMQAIDQLINRRLKESIDWRASYLGQAPQYASHSTKSHLFFESTSRTSCNLAGSEPAPYPLPQNTLTVQVHESFLNTLLDIVELIGEEQAERLVELINEQLAGLEPQDIDVDKLKIAVTKARERAVAFIQKRYSQLSPQAQEIAQQLFPNLTERSIINVLKLVEQLAQHALSDETVVQGWIQKLKDNPVEKIELHDCDVLRVRIEEGELKLILWSPPRVPKTDHPERRQEKVISLRLELRNGVIGIKHTEGGGQFSQLLSQIIIPILDESKVELTDLAVSKLMDLIRNKYSADFEALPTQLQFSLENAELRDGWMTVEIGAQPATSDSTSSDIVQRFLDRLRSLLGNVD